MGGRRPWGGSGIGVRLLAAQAMVLFAAAVTAWTVAVLAGPPLFREHLHRAGSTDPAVEHHAVEAFRSAAGISVAVALTIAALAALVVTWFLSRRLQRSVAAVAAASSAIAAGQFGARVVPAGLGEEFDALGRSFNAMAARLGSVEAVRRRMLSDLAHEMRTPIAVLDAYLEAWEDGVRTFDGDATALLRDQSRRLVRLAEDLSALSRAEEHAVVQAPVPLSAQELVVSAVAAAQAGCDTKGIHLIVEVPNGLPPVLGDRERLGQVLANLLENALRHTPLGGSIRVSAAQVDNGVAVMVADTGEGIAAEHLPHLFERFYRVDPARSRPGGGAGIGLAIVRAIVDAHGGRISVSSAGVGEGACFTVWLPLSGGVGRA